MLPRDCLQATEFREELSRLLDLGDRAFQQWETTFSDFLSPPAILEAQSSLSRFTEVHFVTWGGYPQAERQRLALARIEQPLALEEIPLAGIEIIGNFLFDPASHRDFLGALLGTGLDRGKVGDVLVLGEEGAQAILEPNLLSYVELHLQQVRTVPVKIRSISLDALKIRPPQTKEMVSVEASLRLDAVASAGFGISRGKMVDLIHKDEVRVNWKPIAQPSYTLKVGDMITIRGKGRLTLDDITVTKKSRYRVQMTKLL